MSRDEATAAAVAYTRAVLAGDQEGQDVIADTTDPADLRRALTRLAIALGRVSLGSAVEVDLWLASEQHIGMREEAAT